MTTTPNKVTLNDLFQCLDKYVNKITEVPPGSNKTIFGIRYGMNGVPWCNIYVSEIGKELTGSYTWLGHFAYTVWCAEWWQKQNRWAPYNEPRPGYIVFFDWDGSKSTSKIDHIGVVRAVYSNGLIKVSHGNYSNMCREDIFDPAKVVVGYGKPAFYTAPVTKPKPTAPLYVQYVIRTGDTASSIATKFGMSMKEFLQVNPQIKNANLIYAGDKIRVRKPKNVVIRTIIVRAGDSLSLIAAREKTTVNKILALNPQIKNPNLIHPKDRIRVQ